MLSEVVKVLNTVPTILVTTATAERTFSSLTRPKTYLRSTISQPHLNNMILLHTHKDITDTIDELQIAKKFVEVNDKRKNYFGIFLKFNHHNQIVSTMLDIILKASTGN